jgi:hypothetical protein
MGSVIKDGWIVSFYFRMVGTGLRGYNSRGIGVCRVIYATSLSTRVPPQLCASGQNGHPVAVSLRYIASPYRAPLMRQALQSDREPPSSSSSLLFFSAKCRILHLTVARAEAPPPSRAFA